MHEHDLYHSRPFAAFETISHAASELGVLFLGTLYSCGKFFALLACNRTQRITDAF